MTILNNIALALVIFTLLIFTSCKTVTGNNNAKTNQTKIEFLSIEESKTAILDETYEAYFSKLELREIEVVLGEELTTNNIVEARNFAKLKFSSAVISFNADEKECITYVINEMNSLLTKNQLGLVTNHPWKFIKIQDWLCGGYAHTRGEYIIISQKHLNSLTKKWSKNMSKEDSNSLITRLGSLLVHEQMHSIQRNYPEKFNRLYQNQWDFIKVTVNSPKEITVNQITNPDAPKPEWAFTYNNEVYWVRTLINPAIEHPKMGKDFMDIIFSLEEQKGSYSVKRDISNHLVQIGLKEFKNYDIRFPVNQGLDHPNEISAYMFSKYFISLYNNSNPFESSTGIAKENSEKFITWAKTNLN